MAQRTPLYDRHVALGASMVEFAGYDMPIQYSNMRDEHTAVRQRAGIFDLSHMGEVRIGGADPVAAVQRLITNDLDRIGEGRAQYTAMCNDDGGIIDDLVVYRGVAECWIVVNASRRAVDVDWMRAHLRDGATLHDASDETALIAVQGPRAVSVVAPLVSGVDVAGLRPFAYGWGATVAGVEGVVVSRTGYTGEDGVELYVDAPRAGQVWDALREAGRSVDMLPCGLGARDTLRLEAGLRLYGQDMDESVDPFSAGLGWVVKLDKDDFIGAGALRTIRENGAPRRFAGLRMSGRAIARHGMPVLHEDAQVGEVTSGTYSFTLGCGIATASLRSDVPGDVALQVDIRGTRAGAEQVALPFYKRPSNT
ncbi:MAG TPA: glycine cleavage system aminomethyltransferase GcvT [Candidatus Dormibacteraeota bacterium]|nr:glycine cleavage system aminomethyltransferase GcvT [Candidatus Dormibacteraeota bacterium]